VSEAQAIERDVMQYDVVIVGAGPAGLACAIRLKQLKPSANVCVLEKASAVGAHSPRRGAGLTARQLLPSGRANTPVAESPGHRG
jgi:electron-transferring-flavoprotein dehydrogenase